MEKPKTIFLYSNGTASVWSEAERPLPELSIKGWLSVYLDYLAANGIDPTTVKIEGQMLRASFSKKFFTVNKTEDGWSYTIE